MLILFFFSPNCTDILQLCNSFSADNIKIENIDSVSNRKRAATNGTTTITFYIEAPAGTSSGATIPATVTQTIVTESSDEYEMMTGIPVAGPPEVLIPNPTQPPEDTGVDVALIVVPIVAALMVIVTVVGVILIVVIA